MHRTYDVKSIIDRRYISGVSMRVFYNGGHFAQNHSIIHIIKNCIAVRSRVSVSCILYIAKRTA